MVSVITHNARDFKKCKMVISQAEKIDPQDIELGGNLIQKRNVHEKKENFGYCINCGRSKLLPKSKSQERPFFSPAMQWKNSVCPEMRKTNNLKIPNNINPNRRSSETELSYYHRALEQARSTISCDVTQNNMRREATCNLSRHMMANGMPEVKMASRTCVSCTKITYRVLTLQLLRRISTTKNNQELTSRQATGSCIQDSERSSGLVYGRQFSEKTKLSKSSQLVFTSISTGETLLRILLLCAGLFITNLRDLIASKSRSMRGSGKMTKVTNLLTYMLLFLVATSVASETFAGLGRHMRGRLGQRHPRQSGFRRGMAKPDSERCETITVPTCKDIGYNKTDMSLSIINKFSQSEAQEDLRHFLPLVNLNCSSELKLLLCSIYTPICMKHYPEFLPPCRFVCERVRKGCLPFMQKYGYKWPDNLRCEQFPNYAVGRPMCMHFNLTKAKEEPRNSGNKKKPHVIKPTTSRRKTTTRYTKPTRTTITKPTTASSPPIAKATTKYTPKSKIDSHATGKKKGQQETVKSGVVRLPPTNRTSSACECREPMASIVANTDQLYNRVTTGGVPNCAVSCKSPYFTNDQILVAEIWIKSWSIVCFIVTLMTVSTFLIDMDRFKYPERPIIFLSTCYMFVSIGFLIRIIAGHEAVACAYRTDHVLYHTTGPVLCTTVFLLVYFFSMASALWWVILSMTWFLAAGLKWGSEAIEKYSQYYHAVAWLIPSLQTIMVLAMSSVDGDSLSGICFVGNQDVRALRGFVLAPLVVYLVLGGMFLLAGFISLFRIRNRIRKDGTKTDKLEKLMGRIGIFSVLYMVPAAALVACYFYEQQYRPFWEYSHNCLPEKATQKQTFSYPMYAPVKPEFIVSMVRYLMTLLIGITNGVWICSPKTVATWRAFHRRCVCCLYGAPCPPPCGKEIDRSSVYKGGCDGTRQPDRISPSDEVDQESRDKDADNRSDSFHARKHDDLNRNELSIKTESARSRSTRRSVSNKSSICTPMRGRCDVCDGGSRTSSQNIRGCDNCRKVRRNKSGRSKNGSRRRLTGAESNVKGSEVLCGSNTTSTDGSDRLVVQNGQCQCERKLLAKQDSIQTHFCLKERSVPSRTERSSSSSTRENCRNNSPCHFCEEARENGFALNGNYAINFNDNLPSCSSPSYGSMMSQDCSVGKSVTSLHTSERDEQLQASLLNPVSSHEFDHPTVNSPYYHYHHHHYHNGIRS